MFSFLLYSLFLIISLFTLKKKVLFGKEKKKIRGRSCLWGWRDFIYIVPWLQKKLVDFSQRTRKELNMLCFTESQILGYAKLNYNRQSTLFPEHREVRYSHKTFTTQLRVSPATPGPLYRAPRQRSLSSEPECSPADSEVRSKRPAAQKCWPFPQWFIPVSNQADCPWESGINYFITVNFNLKPI